MPIVLNTNAAATEATFNLSKANDNLRRSISRLSSGSRITKPTDDAGGLAVAYKLQSSVKRTEAALNNHQNALSFLQVQDGVLEAMGDIVDRMSELRTMAADVSKNAADVENYSKEFLELQDQLAQMKREKFNGVELFAVEEEWETMKGVNKSHLKINGQAYDGNTVQTSYGTKESYEYFDHPDEDKRTKSTFDKYEFQLYTNPSGVEEDGNIKLNIVNLQFMLGIKNPNEQFGVEYNLDANEDNTITDAEWAASTYDRDGSGTINGTELADSGLDLNKDGILDINDKSGWRGSGFDDGGATGTGTANDGVIDGEEWTDSGLDVGYDDPDNPGTTIGANDGILDAAEVAAAIAANPALDVDGDGDLDSADAGLSRAAWSVAPHFVDGYGNSVSVGSTINLAGLNQVSLDTGTGALHAGNATANGGPGTKYSELLTSDGYVKDITKISIEEFTNIIEKIADIRAENGAEQARVNQSLSLQQNNLVNLQAAHGRIVDVDVAMESTRLARHSVTVQASAAMVAQANQMTAVALTLLSN
jgi:flagellin-like hook-associated protein FlgL